MEISYLGHSSFKIKGKNASVVTDPFLSSMVGFKFPKVEADMVTVSHFHKDHNFVEGVGGEPFVIDAPGEYEIKGVSVFGFPSFHDKVSGKERGVNTIYVIEVDGLRICHLGDLGTELSAKILEEINGVDILMIPVGGVYTLDPKEAITVIGQIEPLIILPMHFKAQGMTKDYDGLSTVKDFIGQMGTTGTENLDKLVITKDKMPTETKVVILKKKD